MRPRVIAGLALAGAVLSGCQQTTSSQTSMGQVAAPMELDEDADSVWVYLAEKYDADMNARITAAEYDRAGGHFDRLDRDRDGVITAADFESRERGGPGGGDMQAMMDGMRGQRIVAMYFQIDEPSTLSLEELEHAARAYDDDGDEAISETEFSVHADDRRMEAPGGGSGMMRRMMEGVEPWEALIVVVDTDGDGRVSHIELIAFFKARDDGDLVWSLDHGRGGGRRGGSGDDDGARAMSGPAEGELAPDFALQPPDGGETVVLSSFRKNLPVALIFGSYT